MNMYKHFLSLLYTDMTQVVETFVMEDKDLHIFRQFYCQFHVCWWPDDADARSHGISNIGIDFVGPE